jgi:hypothetical protein
MQPNVIVAETIGHRARFAWLGLALAATIALLVMSQLSRTSHDGHRRPGAALVGRSMRVHQCGQHRSPARVEAERAERRARIEAERRANFETDLAQRRAMRAIERAERAERAARAAERAADWY